MTHSVLYSLSIILVLITILCGSNAKLTFTSPAELDGYSIDAFQFKFLGPKEKVNTTARVVLSDPPKGCDWSKVKNKDDWQGNIVIIERKPPSCAPAKLLENGEKGGALAIYMLQKPGEYIVMAGTKYLEHYSGDVVGLNGATDTMKKYDLIVELASNSSVVVTAQVKGDDIESDQGYYVATSVTCGLFALFNIFLGAYKLYEFYKEKGKFEASLPQMCLWFEILGNIERILLSLESDVGLGWGVLDWGAISFFQELILPFCLSPSLMIAFYWDRSLRSFGKSAGSNWNMLSIQRWKIPMIIFCTLIFLLQIFKATLVCLWYGSYELAVIIFLIAAACFLGVGLFFTVTGVKVLRWARNTRATQTEKSKALSSMTNLIVANAFFLLWGFVMHIVMIFSWEAGWLPLLFGINCVSMIQMLIFKPSGTGYSDTSRGSTHSKKTSTNGIEMENTSKSESV